MTKCYGGRGSLKSDKFILSVIEKLANPYYGKSYSRCVMEDVEKLRRIACKHDYRRIDVPKEELIHMVISVDVAYPGKDRMINKKLVFEQKTNEDGGFTCVCRMEDDDGKS